MRFVLVGISAFWTVHFALSGLERAQPFRAREGELSFQHFLAFGEFGIAALFALAAMLTLIRHKTSRADVVATMPWTVGLALIVVAIRHGVALENEALQIATFAEVGLLLMTGVSAALTPRLESAAQENAGLTSDIALPERDQSRSAEIHYLNQRNRDT